MKKKKRQSLAIKDIAQWTAIAGAAAAVVNAIVYVIAAALGVFEGVVVQMGPEPMPFSVLPVLISSFLFICIGGLVLYAIDRFSDQPLTLWRNVAVVALVLSFLQPIFLLDAPTIATVLTLELMHIIAGVIAIYLLTTRVKAA